MWQTISLYGSELGKNQCPDSSLFRWCSGGSTDDELSLSALDDSKEGLSSGPNVSFLLPIRERSCLHMASKLNRPLRQMEWEKLMSNI